MTSSVRHPFRTKASTASLLWVDRKTLDVERGGEIQHDAREFHEELGVDRVLEIIDQQYAAPDAGAQQADLEHAPQALAENGEVLRLVEAIMTDEEPVEPIGRLDVADSGIDARG